METDIGRAPSGRAGGLRPEPQASQPVGAHPSRDKPWHIKTADDAQSLCGTPYAFPHRFSDRPGEATCHACLAVERAEAAQLNLYRQAERDRQLRRAAEEAFDLISPYVAKFAEAASHYDGGTPRYPGSTFLHDPERSYRPCLTSIAIPPCGAPETPTIGDLRLLASSYAEAFEARRKAQVSA